MDLETCARLKTAGYPLEDIVIFFDMDNVEDLIKLIFEETGKPHEIFFRLSDKAYPPLTKEEKLETNKKIERIRTSPDRIERLLIVKIIEYASDGAPIKDIITTCGLKQEVLDTIIIKRNLGVDFQEFIDKHHAQYRLKVRHGLVNKGINIGDSKVLLFLAEKILDDMAPVKQDINVQINQDNRKVVILPPAPSLSQLLEDQRIRKLNDDSTNNSGN